MNMNIESIEDIILGMAEVVEEKRYYKERCKQLEQYNNELCNMIREDAIRSDKSTKEMLGLVLTKTMKDIDEFYEKGK